MKNALRVLVVALTILAFSGLSFAQAKPATPATPPAKEKTTEMKSEKAKTARGEVTSVDAKKGMLTVKTKEKEVDLTADSKTKSALDKVKVGDMVRVSYTEKDGKMIATSVKAESASKATKSEKPEKAAKTPEKKGEMPK